MSPTSSPCPRPRSSPGAAAPRSSTFTPTLTLPDAPAKTPPPFERREHVSHRPSTRRAASRRWTAGRYLGALATAMVVLAAVWIGLWAYIYRDAPDDRPVVDVETSQTIVVDAP